jgi:hypothetical protein
MYFANFPKIVYDFDLGAGTDYRIITDITRNVRLRKQILENISLYDYYDIQEGETPEIISEKVYGTPYYHWVIMLVNQRYDYINDFPLSTLELEAYIARKYGENLYETHHYLQNGVITEGAATITFKEYSGFVGTFGGFSMGDIVYNNRTGYKARVDHVNPQTSAYSVTLTVSMRDGGFRVGDIIRGLYEDTDGEITAVDIAEIYSSVSNYQYEFDLNESKRRIKIVDPAVVEQLVKEFQDIL